MTTTKAELSQAIFDGVGLNQREAKEMVEAFFAEISNCLASGGDVKITGFGSFARQTSQCVRGGIQKLVNRYLFARDVL